MDHADRGARGVRRPGVRVRQGPPADGAVRGPALGEGPLDGVLGADRDEDGRAAPAARQEAPAEQRERPPQRGGPMNDLDALDDDQLDRLVATLAAFAAW